MTDFMDPESGVLREEVFRHFLARETSRATRYQDFFSVCLVKPDTLEGVDVAGPDLVQTLSRKIAQFVRATDLVGRLQEDIAIVLLHTAGSDATRVADRVRAHIEHVGFPAGEGRARRVTVSVGKVSFPRDGYNDSLLLSRAQEYVVEATRQGGNRVLHPGEHGG